MRSASPPLDIAFRTPHTLSQVLETFSKHTSYTTLYHCKPMPIQSPLLHEPEWTSVHCKQCTDAGISYKSSGRNATVDVSVTSLDIRSEHRSLPSCRQSQPRSVVPAPFSAQQYSPWLLPHQDGRVPSASPGTHTTLEDGKRSNSIASGLVTYCWGQCVPACPDLTFVSLRQ